jgi:F-type H+-transporting ATPase subunit epsilon
MAQLTCVVVTPERTALEETVDFVSLPLFDGELGVLPGHSPFIGRLGYGELRLKSGGQERRYYIDGGFVQVKNDVVSLLTGAATPAAEVNLAAARSQLEAAQRMPANSPELFEKRDRAVAQARARIRVAEKTSHT